jgi:hypothetical protein
MSTKSNGNESKKDIQFWSPIRRISRFYPDKVIKSYVKFRPSGELHEIVDEFIDLTDNQRYIRYRLSDSSEFRRYTTDGKFLKHEGA